MSWEEREHPRDKRGRFREKGTADWSRLASERLAAPGGHVDRVEGRDLLGELTEADWEALADRSPSLYAVASGTAPNGDEALADLWTRQGFDGLPRVVDGETMQRAIDSGWFSLWRAVGSTDDEYTGVHTDAEVYAEQYRSGPPRPSLGAWGNGAYFAPDRAKDNLLSWYAQGDGALIHAALSPEARVANWDELREEMAAEGITHELLYGDDSSWTPRERVLADVGRFAAARGYDAIMYWQSPVYRERGEPPAEIVVLNRTAVIVEAADG